MSMVLINRRVYSYLLSRGMRKELYMVIERSLEEEWHW